MTRATEENRGRQILVGGLILLGVTLSVCAALIGSRFQQGLIGEWVSLMVGIMTTPFFMEASFLILGIIIVISLNTWRRRKEGDELVYLERVEGSDAAGLPDHASWAVYADKPLDGEIPSRLAQAEGALAIGDYALAAEWIAAMPREELGSLAAYELRIALAEATGRKDLARHLQDEMKALRQGGEA